MNYFIFIGLLLVGGFFLYTLLLEHRMWNSKHSKKQQHDKETTANSAFDGNDAAGDFLDTGGSDGGGYDSGGGM